MASALVDFLILKTYFDEEDKDKKKLMHRLQKNKEMFIKDMQFDLSKGTIKKSFDGFDSNPKNARNMVSVQLFLSLNERTALTRLLYLFSLTGRMEGSVRTRLPDAQGRGSRQDHHHLQTAALYEAP